MSDHELNPPPVAEIVEQLERSLVDLTSLTESVAGHGLLPAPEGEEPPD
jgi:hypothetical protein